MMLGVRFDSTLKIHVFPALRQIDFSDVVCSGHTSAGISGRSVRFEMVF